MKKGIILGFGLALMLTACGNSKSSDAIYGEMNEKFKHPTGTLTADNAEEIAHILSEKTGQGTAPIPSSLQRAIQASEMVQRAISDDEPLVDCSGAENQMQHYTGGRVTITCTCNVGGTLSFQLDPNDFMEEDSAFVMTYTYNQCTITDGETTASYDGKGIIAKEGTNNADYYYQYKGTATVNGETETIDIEYYFSEDGTVWYLVSLEDGTYICNGYYDPNTDSGSWTVRDEDGDWDCSSTAGSGSCTDGIRTIVF